MALPNTSFLAEKLETRPPEQIDRGLEWAIKSASLNVLYWLRNYLEKQQKIEDDFQKMKRGEIETSEWEHSKSKFQEDFHVNKINEILTEQESLPADEQWKTSSKLAKLDLMPENIEAIKIVREYRLGALSNKLRELIKSVINSKIDKDLDKIYIDEKTGRLKGPIISVKGTGLDTSKRDAYEPGHGHDLYTNMMEAERGRRPDDLLGETEDEEYEEFLTGNDRGRFIPIEDIDESDEDEGATFTDEYYYKRDKARADFNRQRADARKKQTKIKQAKSQEEEVFLARRRKLWPKIEANHNGLSLDLLNRLVREKKIYNYTLEMVRDYLITLLLGNNDVANTFQLQKKMKNIKSEEINLSQISRPPYFIRKFNLEHINIDNAELLKDELQRIIASSGYLKEKIKK